MWRRRVTPSFWRRTSQCAFTVLGEIPSWQPISSFEQPAAISSTTCRCRVVSAGLVFTMVASMATTLQRVSTAAYCPKGVFPGLRPRRHGRLAHERSLVPAPVRLVDLVLVEGADPQEQLELVAQVRPHHLWPVGGDRERDAVLDERAEGGAH